MSESWYSWLTRSSDQKIKDRQERQRYYQQGTVVSGEHKGKHVGEVLGQKPPPHAGLSDIVGEIGSALEHTPLKTVLPTHNPLENVFRYLEEPQTTALQPAPSTPPTYQVPTGGVDSGRPTITSDSDNNNRNVGLRATLSLPTTAAPDNNNSQNSVTDFLKAASSAVGEARKGPEVSFSVPVPDQGDANTSGVSTKQGYNVGGDEPMLAWLAEIAPQTLAALAAGMAGQMGAEAAKKIVGDDPVMPSGPELRNRLFGLSLPELNSLSQIYSRATAAGPTATFGQILDRASPSRAYASSNTIPAQTHGPTQLVADAALLSSMGAAPPASGTSDASSLALANMMRGFGQEPKLIGNQTTMIVPPNTPGAAVTPQPGNPQPPRQSLGSQLAEIAGATGNGLTQVARDAVVNSATEIGGAVLEGAAPAIQRMIEASGKRVGSWLAGGLGQLATKLTRKIVGDDPFVMPHTGGRVRKVVGDPPMIASGQEQQQAAIALGSSQSMHLAAARLVMEQLMSSLVPIPPTGNKEELGQAIVAAAQPDYTMYNSEPIDTEAERVGMTLWPALLPVNADNTYILSYFQTRPPFARVVLVQPEQSVPIRETPLAASIAPMLVGAPITEYSGALRIRTLRTDFDMLMTVLGRSVPDLMSDGGYSAARPLAVALCLAGAYGMLPGTETSCMVSGLAFRQMAGMPVPLGQPFPCTNAFNNWDGAIAWCSLGEYARALNGDATSVGAGGAAPWDQRFTPDKWDKTCAVVPIYQEEMLDMEGNAIRMLMNCEHPFLIHTYPVQWLQYQQGGYAPIVWGATVPQPQAEFLTAFPNTSLTYIEGPRASVLFVVVDMPRRVNARVLIGSEQVNLVIDAVNNPTNPVVPPGANQQHPVVPVIQAFMALPAFVSALATQIQRLEQQMLTASDRSSAMRLVADCNLRFGPVKSYARNVPGANDSIGGYCPVDFPGINLPNEYVGQSVRAKVESGVQMITTASGVMLQTLNGYNINLLRPTHRLGRYSSMLQALAMRGMIMWQEEKAQVPMGAVAPLCEIIYEVGVMTAALTDIVLQQESQTLRDWQGPRDGAFGNEDTLSKLNKRNRVYPQLQRVFMAGIQYPVTTPNYDNMDFQVTANAFAALYDVATASACMARVPWIGLNKYFGGFMPSLPIINLSSLSMFEPRQYEQVRMTTGAQQRERYMNAFSLKPEQSALVDEAGKLSLSAIPDVNHLNPAVFFTDMPTTYNANRLAFPILPPDHSYTRAAAYSMYNAGVIDLRFECVALPIGEQLPIFNIRSGRRRRFYVDGYSSMFRMPGGTAAVRIITSPDSAAGLVDAELFPNDYPWLYQTGGHVVSN